MINIFADFFEKEWVQVSTSFAYIIVLLLTPILYWRISLRFDGEKRKIFVDAAYDIYGVIIIPLLAPTLYLILYFFGGESTFMLKDPIPLVCCCGGGTAAYETFNTRRKLKYVATFSNCKTTIEDALKLKKASDFIMFSSILLLGYGVATTIVANLMPQTYFNFWIWPITFLVSLLGILFPISSKLFSHFASKKFETASGLD